MGDERGRPNVKKVLRGLKDFQRTSVDYVFQRLYGKKSTRRFLLADEVGLGKTLVARGVIARSIKHLWQDVDRIDVVYICSNADIARQNVNRLNISGQSRFQLSSRLTLLPAEIQNLKGNKVNFVALTPGTSFDLRSNLGRGDERVLLYWLLRRVWKFPNQTGPLNVLRGNMAKDNFRWAVKEFSPKKIDRELATAFGKALKAEDRINRDAGRLTLRRRFRQLCQQFHYHRKHIPWEQRQERAAVIGELRALLAATCIQALEPDLIILDEFQRFKHLLNDETEAGRLARHLFDWQEARVLLLSATPYKMYTMGHESEDEDHYADFLDTLDFLLGAATERAEVRQLLRRYRRGLYRIGQGQTDGLEQAKQELELRLRRVIARTERLAVTEDRSGMLREVPSTNTRLTVTEVDAYLQLQQLSRYLDAGDVIEYWKSAPYLLNFMDQYQLKRRLRERTADFQLCTAIKAIQDNGDCLLLPWDQIRRYQSVDPGNARLVSLTTDTIEQGLWRLLWIPPSLPYYGLGGPFADPRIQRPTKRLVFSSWQVVPKALSVLLSYQAEREMMRLYEPEAANTPEARRQRRGLLRFTISPEGRLTGMPVLGLLYPSIALSRRVDPLGLGLGVNGNELPSCDELLAAAKEELRPAVESLTQSAPTSGPVDETWYWATPILLDLQEERVNARNWLLHPQLADIWASEDEEEGDGARSRWHDHVDEARRLAEGDIELRRPPADLLTVVAQMALGGPAVAMLRALSRVAGGPSACASEALRDTAGRVAFAFRTLFNIPEVMWLIRGLNAEEPYWRRVLEYCVDGCLQSVLDEYVHVLRESLGLVDAERSTIAEEIGEAVTAAVGLRVAMPGVDEIRCRGQISNIHIDNRPTRARFAMRFGDEKGEDGRTSHRADQVRQAFNSPFWPFVLATTSIGQEGLDFHQYCHAVVHWNLPSNPVDLEQREGRVHRYKGHAVRKNVASRYGAQAGLTEKADPWECMFDAACQEEDRGSDLKPFWVYPIEDGAVIERHVPALPLTREWDHLPQLKSSLALYRMVFGQPRQDDLLAYLMARMTTDRLKDELDRLRIDLSPQTGVSR